MNRLCYLATLLFAAWPLAAASDDGPLQLADCRIRAGDGFPGIKARCGTLERPENPADPDSRLLHLHVAVVPALSLEPEPDPLVPIAGGPGQGSIAFYASVANAFEDIRRNRDIVLLDQRGTGRSATMQCAAGEDVLEGRFSAAETAEAAAACLESLPHDPRYFTTSVAVTDLEALRVALGYERFNLYGISYGSRVAQHYLRRYPATTRSVILDGVVPPQLALGPAIAVDAQHAMDAILSRCAEDEACHGRFPDLATEFSALRQQLADAPLTLDLSHPLHGTPETVRFGANEFSGALRLLSYHPSTVALVPLLVDQAARGNAAPLAAQYVMVAESMAEALAIGMHNAVVCTEDAPFFGDAAITRDALEATYIGPMQLDALQAICSVWPQGVLDDDFKTPVASDVPVLLLSGENDPITPPAYGDLAAVDLGNFRHLTGSRQGHGIAPRGCMPGVIGRFVADAAVEALDRTCHETLFSMPFFLDFSGPSP